MDQLQQILAGLTRKQKLSIVLAASAMAALILFGVKWNKERDLRALYTNLEAEDAGAVVEKLRAAGVEYKVADGGAILVPSGRVAELRLEMASAGLPRTGRIGFELFDKANLGATEFAEQVNYRRAMEGELERSVMALAEVERARVHITFPKDSVFVESRQPGKASVLVKLRAGQRLSPQNVTAITHLTASAVEGLQPEAVSVVDMTGNLLSRPRNPLDESTGAGSGMIEYRQTLEKEMLAKIRATLDPLLGEDKYRAGVSLECDFTSGEQSEEQFDPEKSVMVSSSKTEDLSGAAASGGVPGTASNLPRPVPKAAGSSGGVARRSENIAYQTSRVVKHTKLPQGTVKRLSVSVLVDQAVRWEGAGPKAKRVLEPPPPERLKVVKDVLAGVVGFQQDRGDQILVESLPFEATLQSAPPEGPAGPLRGAPAAFVLPAWLKPWLDKAPTPVWIGAGVSLVIVFLVGLFWVFRTMRRKRQPAASVQEGAAALPRSREQEALAAAEEFEHKIKAQLEQNEQDRMRQESEVLSALKLPPTTKKSEVLKKHLSDEAKKDPVAIAQLIRTWLNEGEK